MKKATKDTCPRCEMTVQMIIKNCIHPGYYGGTYNLGKEGDPVPLGHMLTHVLRLTLEHYALFISAEEMNAELDKFRALLSDVSMQPPKE